MDLCAKLSKKEDCVVTKFIRDIANLYVEVVKICVGETLWRWLVRNGSKSMKQGKSGKVIW